MSRNGRFAAPLMVAASTVGLLTAACGVSARASDPKQVSAPTTVQRTTPAPRTTAGPVQAVSQIIRGLSRQGTGHLYLETFYSEGLHRRADYMIYLPPGYSATLRYPVYYLLHGMPGQPHVFVTLANMDIRLDTLLAEHRIRPMILVFPDGRINGNVQSDSEWANTPSGSFESYVVDVMHNVDASFSTIPSRTARVIAGFSSGAYGAVNIALHHLADFGAVQAWSGYYLQTRTGVFARASRAALSYNSPLVYVRGLGRALARYPIKVYLFIGRDDGSSSQQTPMARALSVRGTTVGSAIYPGGHQWGVWYPRLDQMLELASRDT